MTPEQLAKSGTEHAEQMALFCWAAMPEIRAKYPELRWMHAIPNAGARGNKIAAANLKAEGVKAGVADILLPVKRIRRYACVCDGSVTLSCGLYIEMKRKLGVPSDVTTEQREFMLFAESQGYVWTVAFGWEKAAQEIQCYMAQV